METEVTPPQFFSKFADTYDYAKNIDVDLSTLRPTHKVELAWKCPECGHEWVSKISSRWRGANKPVTGCPECGKMKGKQKVPGEQDSLKARHPALAAEWSSRNSYGPESVYPNYATKVWWVCSTCSHEWEQTPNYRVRRPACPACVQKRIESHAQEKEQQKRSYWDTVKAKGNLTDTHSELVEQWSPHNDRSPDSVTAGSSYRAQWVCAEGHQWTASVYTRTQGHGCKQCADNALTGRSVISISALSYNPVVSKEWSSKNSKSPDEIYFGSGYLAWWKCPVCFHEWQARVNDRISRGKGCPRCAKKMSRPEQELFEYVRDDLGFGDAVQSTRRIIAPYEIDIYVPSKKVGIEFNGLYWHSEDAGKGKQYHYNKWRKSVDHGVQLITVWEDDWRDRQHVVKALIAHKLGVSSRPRVFARKCVIGSVDLNSARQFLESNHIQGFVSGSEYLGLYHEDSLVACAVFRKETEVTYLQRYATSFHVIGGLGKLLACVPGTIVTFADHEVSDGGLYERLGFRVDKELKPDYCYLYQGKRVHKFNFRLRRFRTDPSLQYQEGLTERELAVLNNIPCIWDSGKVRYVLDR